MEETNAMKSKQHEDALKYWAKDLHLRFTNLCSKIAQEAKENSELIESAKILITKKEQDLINLLRRQTHNSIDPELLSWEVWTNELIKWSEQKYKYPMPIKSDIKSDKVIVTYRKYLALFLKELNDKGPACVPNPTDLMNNSVYSNAKLSGSKRSHDQMVSVEDSKNEESKISQQKVETNKFKKQDMTTHLLRTTESFKIQNARTLSLDHKRSSSMSVSGNEPKNTYPEYNRGEVRSEVRADVNVYHDIPSKVRRSISNIYNISNKIKQLKEEFNANFGTLQTIHLAQLNMQPEKCDFTVENVLKTIEEINERPAKIVENTFLNVYKRKNEWYSNPQKDLFYASIREMVYQPSSIPLRKEIEAPPQIPNTVPQPGQPHLRVEMK